jgi:hypothetical protein
MSLLAVANALGQAGLATIAIDSVLSGFNGEALFRSIQVSNILTGNTELYPFLNNDAFVTRDNIRQNVVDLMQLIRVLKACASGTCLEHGFQLDPERIYFLGVGMGGIIGTLLASLSPDIERAAFNATGAGITDILTQSPVFREKMVSLLCLGNILTAACCADSCSIEELNRDPSFAQFHLSNQWILDPADPINYVEKLSQQVAANQKQILIQKATADKVIPNSATDLMATRLGVTANDYQPSQPCADDPTGGHGMLLDDCGSGTQAMQHALVEFFSAP